MPGLARTWTRSQDGLSYALELQRDAKWHDGTPVTADDVAFTLRYMAEHPYVLDLSKRLPGLRSRACMICASISNARNTAWSRVCFPQFPSCHGISMRA
ncbi:ABC transporter substrate-binding protein [Phaeobacter inhibens]|uniref:ABC transporter substrate-binding protein n=1 Tax=Phaeobacter inhibens TaxID=221822 RepID=UPI0021A5B7BB|nr:ABC transporter substrate-binding protein [Phaeobacter inhibens]